MTWQEIMTSWNYKNKSCGLLILKYVYPKYNISSTTTTMMLSCCISNFNLNYKRTDVMVRDMYMIMWQLKYDITKIFFLYKFHFFISCFLSLFAFPFFVQRNIASYAEFVCLNKYFFDDLGLEHRDLEESIDTNCFLNKTLISHLCTSYFYYNVNVHFA